MKNKPSTVLAIRLSALGDVAMTVPLCNLLSKQYPELKIIVLTKPQFEPLFDHLKTVSVLKAEVYQKHKGLLGLWRLFQEIKGHKIDSVADLHNVLRSNILGILFKLHGIHVQKIDKGRKEKKALTAAKNKVFQAVTPTVDRYKEVFSKLGYPLGISKDWITPKRKIPGNFNYRPEDSRIWIGIAPFAAHSGKCYPLDLMEKVLEELDATTLYRILLFGGGSIEEEIANKWEKKYANCESLLGKMEFEEELAIISNLRLMVAMDSGNGHLSAMFGVPTITLWGVTHPYAGFAPYGQPKENSILSNRKEYPLIPTSVYGNKMPEGYENVMETITPASVVSRIVQICEQ